MSEIPMYPPDKQPVIRKNGPVDPVARSIAKRDAFAKPASFPGKGVRVRPMNFKAQRKKKKDPRDVTFY